LGAAHFLSRPVIYFMRVGDIQMRHKQNSFGRRRRAGNLPVRHLPRQRQFRLARAVPGPSPSPSAGICAADPHHPGAVLTTFAEKARE